jgi:hypothetical protein
MKYKIDFNNTLGVFPVSLFIEIEENDKIKIFEVWDKIQEYSCRDVIFHGNTKQYKNNVSELTFLSTRLIANVIHTSIILSEVDDTLFKELYASRLIVFFNSNTSNSTYFKNNVQQLSYLSTKDIIILNPTSLKEFLFTRQYLIEKEIKAKIMLKMKTLDNQENLFIDLLKNKIYDIYPYYGEIYV